MALGKAETLCMEEKMKRAINVLFAAVLSIASIAFAVGGVADAASRSALTAAQKKAFKGKVVAFVPLSLGFDLTEGWNAMMREQLTPLGIKYIVRDPNWNTQAGAQAISALINENVNVLVVQNPDLLSYARLLKKANQRGIYVIQINMQSSYPTDAFVGGNFVENGRREAEALVNRCAPGKGPSNKVAIVEGVLTAGASIDQMKGINEVLSKHPEIKVVSNQAGNWDPTKSRSITSIVLKRNPDLCGVINFWDGSAIGSAAAIQQANMRGKVVLVTDGGGEQTAACDNIANGNYTVYLDDDVRRQSNDIVKVIKKLLVSKQKAGSKHRVLYTPLTILTKSSLKPNSCWKLSNYKKR